MKTQSLLDSALEYADKGFRIFPVIPGGKSPLTANGFNDATYAMGQIETWWTDHPTANIGCALDGLFVVDIDPGGETWLESEPEKNIELLTGATQKTPRGGYHHIFRRPDGCGWNRKVGIVHDNVDLLTDGGYIILPPSRIIGVGQYQWIEGCELDSWESLPRPLAWLKNTMDRLHKPTTKGKSTGGNEIPEGRRNDTLASIAGQLRRSNMPRSVVEAAIYAADLSQCKPPIQHEKNGEQELQRIIDSAMRNMASDQQTEALAFGLADSMEINLAHPLASPGPVDDIDQPASDPGEFPLHLLECGGIMQQFCEYADRVSRRPQPVLSMAAALSLMSVITGRKIKDETGTRGNVYCVAVAEAGNGKNNGLESVKKILLAVKGQHLLQAGSFHSESAVWTLLIDQPCKLAVIDEFGCYLSTVNSSKASSHLRSVQSVIMELFSLSGSMASPKASADRSRNIPVDQPHLVILGASTPTTFFESITQENVESGLLPRMLFFTSNDDVDLRLDVPDSMPPLALLVRVEQWVKLEVEGNLEDKFTPGLITASYTPDARELFRDIHSEVTNRERTAKNEFKALWRRCLEMVRKVTLLHACSVSDSPRKTLIGKQSVEWAWELIEYLYRKMEYLVETQMASSEFEKYQKRFTNWLNKQPGQRASRTKAMKNMLCRFPKFLRQDLIETLIQSGVVWVFEKETKTRSGIYYSMNPADKMDVSQKQSNCS